MSAPAPLLLTFYGDDFSGSTDVLEALTVRGVPSVLFLQPPAPKDLERFPDCRAVGVAGQSRSQSPEWMDQNLPPVFSSLRDLGAPFCHYKLCSTFDSSPTHGSIGRAIEIGKEVFQTACVPLIVGAPLLRRYVLFANLFATVDGEGCRIDRHPTMSRHPVTPMTEADLRLHLRRQTTLPCASVDILALQAGQGLERFRQAADAGAAIVLFDTLDAQSLRETGRAIWESRPPRPSFIAGSSGVEYALLAWWESLGLLPPQPAIPDPPPVDRLLVVSGSCSPVTSGQIHWARQNGFQAIPLDPIALLSGELELERALAEANAVLAEGGSPILYSADGPADILATPETDPHFGQKLGSRLGALASTLVRRHRLQRTVIAGGDTSGYVGRALSIQALTMLRPFAPGSPLCRIWSSDPTLDAREILFKGGQVGPKSLFADVRQGAPL